MSSYRTKHMSAVVKIKKNDTKTWKLSQQISVDCKSWFPPSSLVVHSIGPDCPTCMNSCDQTVFYIVQLCFHHTKEQWNSIYVYIYIQIYNMYICIKQDSYIYVNIWVARYLYTRDVLHPQKFICKAPFNNYWNSSMCILYYNETFFLFGVWS